MTEHEIKEKLYIWYGEEAAWSVCALTAEEARGLLAKRYPLLENDFLLAGPELEIGLMQEFERNWYVTLADGNVLCLNSQKGAEFFLRLAYGREKIYNWTYRTQEEADDDTS